MLVAPLVTRFIPRNTLLDDLNNGINPEWDGFIHEPIIYGDGASPMLDEINAVTMRYLNASALPDTIFQTSPFYDLLFRKEGILDAGGQIVGPYGRMPGEPWFRLSAGLQQSGRAPRLPA